MSRPAVYITRPMPDAVLEQARALFDVSLRDSNLPLTTEEMLYALSSYDAILPTLGDRFSAEVFAQCPDPRAQMLANFGVGYDHINVDAARLAGVQVSNTPGVLTEATADIALTLMLMVARRAGEGERLLRAGCWDGWNPTQLMGRSLSGKTIGIIGTGRIGIATARRAHFGFGMEVVYHNRSTPDLGDLPATQLGFEEVMAKADFVSLHTPGGASNRHLVSKEMLSRMKPSAYLINTARGDVVDQAALIELLASGAIAGAGLDVYDGEPEVPAQLKAMQNVVLLPHLGSATLETRTKMGLMAVENLRAFFAAEPLPNPV